MFVKQLLPWLKKFWPMLGLLLLAATLRLWQLGSYPVSMYWEEVALGYDAYSLAQTGKDHHGASWPLVAFESFGDWKPSGYFYAVVPFVKVLGTSVWAVRLPSALAGVALVLGIGVLSYQLTRSKGVLLLTMFVASLSNWLVMFSRGGWEVNLATACLVWGVVLLWQWRLNWLNSSWKSLGLLLAAGILMTISAYTYHATRFIAPLMGLVLVLHTFVQHWLKNRRFKQASLAPILLIGILLAALNLPWIASFSGSGSQRVNETTALADAAILESVATQRELAGNTALAKLFNHRYWAYGNIMLRNTLDHFRIDFLFLSGDLNPRHSTHLFGVLYPADSILLLIGIFYWITRRPKIAGWLVLWLAIVLFPISFTKATPHALRLLPATPVYILTIAVGGWQSWLWLKQLVQIKAVRYGVLMAALTGYSMQFGLFWHDYTTVYAQTTANEWQTGYREMISELHKIESEYPNLPVFISRTNGRPLMYYWFFNQVDPARVQAEEKTAAKDQGERLEFANKVVVTKLSEVELPGIVALTAADWPEWLQSYPDHTPIKVVSTNGSDRWYLVVIE